MFMTSQLQNNCLNVVRIKVVNVALNDNSKAEHIEFVIAMKPHQNVIVTKRRQL